VEGSCCRTSASLGVLRHLGILGSGLRHLLAKQRMRSRLAIAALRTLPSYRRHLVRQLPQPLVDEFAAERLLTNARVCQVGGRRLPSVPEEF
jgi:hypothetical protein